MITCIGRDVIRYDSVPSTNELAKELARRDAPEGVVVVSEVQSKGRGRKDRHWSSQRGGLYFSMILYPDIVPDMAMLVTMSTSMAVSQSLKELGIDATIKWPNDLLIRGKKVAGILTELSAQEGKVSYMVVGVGINVSNILPKDLKDIATSLKDEMGIEIDKELLFDTVLENMDLFYSYLIEGQHEFIRESWLRMSNIVGKRVTVRENETQKTGTVKGIDHKGRLILLSQGREYTMVTGDVDITS